MFIAFISFQKNMRFINISSIVIYNILDNKISSNIISKLNFNIELIT